VVATPIGNLADITLRAIEVLSQADLIAAEDTRHTRRLLSAHGIKNTLLSYHEHNEHRRTPELSAKLEQGAVIALVSNAGTPLVSDPGYRLVSHAAARNIPVVPIPGPSAVMAALSAGGLPTDSFTFIGFPARKKNKRIRQLKALADHWETLVFYQAPLRILPFLKELMEILGDRQAVLAREITKRHEEFIRGSLSHVHSQLSGRDAIKGECTILVQGIAQAEAPDDNDLETILRSALAQADAPLGEIVRSLARQYKVNKNRLYEMALRIKKDGNP
jgi:16S rRNA (cytidine1402-2'-O)-methyltransferase